MQSMQATYCTSCCCVVQLSRDAVGKHAHQTETGDIDAGVYTPKHTATWPAPQAVDFARAADRATAAAVGNLQHRPTDLDEGGWGKGKAAYWVMQYLRRQNSRRCV